MTANQVIVLLDVSRGFDKSRHLGTVDEDVKKLLKENLIKEGGGFTYELTWKGKAVVDRILEQAELR
jgi:predicted transcriptional regulator